MKIVLFLFSCIALSFPSFASKKLPDFDVIKTKMENFGVLPAKEWKNIKGDNIALVDGVQFWANDRAVATIHLLKGSSTKELEEKLLDTTVVCLKLSRSTMGELTEEQANDIILTVGYAGKVDDRQVSAFVNGYSFFSSLIPSSTKSEIIFTCGVRQNDF